MTDLFTCADCGYFWPTERGRCDHQYLLAERDQYRAALARLVAAHDRGVFGAELTAAAEGARALFGREGDSDG